MARPLAMDPRSEELEMTNQPTLEAVWRKTDPRELIKHRAFIVIFDTRNLYTVGGQAEVKFGGSVTIYDQDGTRETYIARDVAWPEHWQWAYAPIYGL